jgi:hypothetical protein
MTHKGLTILLVAGVLVALSPLSCSGQKSGETEFSSDQAPPPSSSEEAQMEQPAPPSQQADAGRASSEHRGTTSRTETIPEERPRRVVPQAPPAPQTVDVDIPAGTSLALSFAEALTSETALVGDAVTASLKSPVVVGDRVVFPAGSQVEGKVTDVKSAKKGFKDTGGALAITFDRVVTPDGRRTGIAAGFTKVAEGSGKKKAGIIGGSAVGGALLGKVLGKDAKGAAIIGGAIGTAVAGGTKGKEATIAAEESITVALERPARTTLKR